MEIQNETTHETHPKTKWKTKHTQFQQIKRRVYVLKIHERKTMYEWTETVTNQNQQKKYIGNLKCKTKQIPKITRWKTEISEWKQNEIMKDKCWTHWKTFSDIGSNTATQHTHTKLIKRKETKTELFAVWRSGHS